MMGLVDQLWVHMFGWTLLKNSLFDRSLLNVALTFLIFYSSKKYEILWLKNSKKRWIKILVPVRIANIHELFFFYKGVKVGCFWPHFGQYDASLGIMPPQFTQYLCAWGAEVGCAVSTICVISLTITFSTCRVQSISGTSIAKNSHDRNIVSAAIIARFLTHLPIPMWIHPAVQLLE